ncbi:MAG: general stress protein [Acetobacteraceae bacterium]|nr:general stress protein [Acetobacteraceae bacterium]
MARMVVGVFSSRSQADRAVDDLKGRGFSSGDISVVTREEGRGARGGEEARLEGRGGQDITGGLATGGALGGLAGLLAGAGALAIPGIGPVLAAGPIAAALSGAVTGGIAGGLIDFGIPAERGRFYEEEVKKGKILAAVRADEERAEEAARTLRDNGAQDVETHEARR